MSELPQDAWFYARGGERIGPVTLADLRVKVQEATLNPRLDLVWTQGMAEWLPAGEIPELFDKRRAVAPEDSPNPYATPGRESVMRVAEGEWPGARRRSFLIATIIFPFVWNIAFAKSAGFLQEQLGPDIMAQVGIGAAILPVLVGIYYGLMRLVNLGMSRWWYLGNLVPLLNLWVGYRCFACPAGYAYSKKLDGPGVALAIIYWLLMLVCILAIAAIAALWFEWIDSPALQEQLGEALRTLRDQAAKP